VYTLVLCEIFFSQQVLSGPVPDPNTEAIEAAVTKLKDDNFKGDRILHQQVDRPNKISTYRNPTPPEEEGTVVFTRNSVDKGKLVIVLNREEDYLPRTAQKKTYVVLRRKGDSTSTEYYVFYAYIR